MKVGEGEGKNGEEKERRGRGEGERRGRKGERGEGREEEGVNELGFTMEPGEAAAALFSPLLCSCLPWRACVQRLYSTCGVSTQGSSQSLPPPSVKDQAATPVHLPPLI